MRRVPVHALPMTTDDRNPKPPGSDPAATAPTRKKPPRLFECKLCGKVFDAEQAHPTCSECDSNEVEQVG